MERLFTDHVSRCLFMFVRHWEKNHAHYCVNLFVLCAGYEASLECRKQTSCHWRPSGFNLSHFLLVVSDRRVLLVRVRIIQVIQQINAWSCRSPLLPIVSVFHGGIKMYTLRTAAHLIYETSGWGFEPPMSAVNVSYWHPKPYLLINYIYLNAYKPLLNDIICLYINNIY